MGGDVTQREIDHVLLGGGPGLGGEPFEDGVVLQQQSKLDGVAARPLHDRWRLRGGVPMMARDDGPVLLCAVVAVLLTVAVTVWDLPGGGGQPQHLQVIVASGGTVATPASAPGSPVAASPSGPGG